MKIYKIKYARLMLACLSFAILGVASCKKDEKSVSSCSGSPVIVGVYQPDRESALAEGTYNQFILIKGENLCSVKKLMFNDVEVDVRQIHAAGNELTVKIPNSAPDDVSDELIVETAEGRASHPFKINIPPVKIIDVDNEYAPVNRTMILVGQSFDLAGLMRNTGKLYFGSNEAAIQRATVDSLIVTVPAGAAQGDIIKIVDKNGNEFPYQYPYMDNTNMVVDYDAKPTSVWSRANYVGQDDLPGAISGNYAHFVEKLRTGFAQDEFVKGKVVLPQDVVDNPGNYVLKFEVNTSLPLSMAGIRIFADLSSNKYYAWSPTAAAPFNTKGKWVTHSISLQAANGNTTPLAARANNEYQIRGIVTTGVTFNMDISFDNWRIVAKPAN